MHEPYKTRRIPDHMIFLGAFAAIAAAAAYAFHARPDAQRAALVDRPAVAKPAVDTGTWSHTHDVLGIREVTPNESRSVAIVDNVAAPAPREITVAEQSQPTIVAQVDAPRHRSARHRRHAHASAWPSDAGGARSLASLPPPGD
jgi:hypothetical protein